MSQLKCYVYFVTWGDGDEVKEGEKEKKKRGKE